MSKLIWLMFLFTFIFSCGSEDKTKSELDWGHLNLGGSAPILNVKPGETLGVCGPKNVGVIAAAKEWASHTNRKDGFKIISGCNQRTNIYTEVWSQERMCRHAGQRPGCGIMGLAIRNKLIVVSGASNTNLLLHETGHLFGMCDQYADRGRWQSSCSRYWRTGRMFTMSAMGAVAPGRTRLTQDDVRGIQNLTKRVDLKANEPWIK